MAPVLAIEDIRVVFGTRTVLDGVTAGIDRGARIGVVGRNGDGKSTLLRVLAGLHEPDSGRVIRSQDARMVLVGQSDDLPPGARTVRDVTVGSRPAHEWASDPRVRDVLVGLLGGLGAELFGEGLDTGLTGLSGGERRRLALAAALLDPGDVLALDEPTNHLDLAAITWLAEHLTGPWGPPALVVVTHDRWFLDQVCTSTWEVVGGQVRRLDGGYAVWVLARAERERRADAAEVRRRSRVSTELAWLRRGPPARTTKPRFRVEAANALIADVPDPRDRMVLRSLSAARLGRTVVELEDATVRVPDGRTLIDGLTWQLGPGDRVGLLGPNGAGKTTLARVLLGSRPVDAGKVTIGGTVRPAELAQTIVPGNPEDRVLDSVARVRREVEVAGRTVPISALLEDLGFRGERAAARLGDLSGGELRRLELLTLLIGAPNLLVLDEPTNDLDIDTLTLIEQMLDTWPGSLVVISHDRYFLERVCDDVYALVDRTLRHLPQGVESYLELIARAGGPGAKPAGAPSTPRTSGALRAPGATAHAMRKDLARVEERLERIALTRADLAHQMAVAHADHVALTELAGADAELAEEQEQVEMRWLELGEALEG